MQKLFSVLVITSIMSITPTFGAESVSNIDTTTKVNVAQGNVMVNTTQSGTTVKTNTTEIKTQPTATTISGSVNPFEMAILSAASSTGSSIASSSIGGSLGEYKAVECSANPAYSTNSCNQCFIGGSVKVGGDISGLFDAWTNNTTNMLVAYKDEQKNPTLVAFGSTWTPTPSDLTKFWKNSAEVTWVPAGASGSRMNYILQPGQKVKFLESELGARYVLTKSDKKDGELVGLLKYPIVSHAVDATTGNEGAANTHYECVSYTLSAAVTPTPAPPKPETPKPTPTPAQVTQTATGPAETLILIIAAFFIAFGMMFSLRKRN